MVKLNQPGRMQSLIDMDKGTIGREIFVDTDIFQQELERVFARTWLYVGHESQIPTPTIFFISRMGEESVILTRDRQGEIHVLLNTCRHRGMKVCRYDEGNTPVFSCPYHGWSYSTDGNLVSVPGELIGVPQFATAYHGELEKEEWGLISVPKMANYHGSIWACWDKEAPDFLDYLGGIDAYLAPSFQSKDGEPGGLEALGGVQKYYLMRAHETRQKRNGGRGPSSQSGGVSTILPNMSTLRVLTVAVWHPVGPMMTEGWRWDFVDRNAPPEVKDYWRHQLLTWSGPTGQVEGDDMENWNYASEASNGTNARRQPITMRWASAMNEPVMPYRVR